MRDMRDQFSSVLSMGSLNQVVSMIPGLNANMLPKGREKEGTARIKRFLCMMDSMTEEELDNTEENPGPLLELFVLLKAVELVLKKYSC